MTRQLHIIRFGLQRTKWALIALCLTGYLLLVRLSGGSLTGMFWFWLCLLGYLVLPGLLLVRVLGLHRQLPAGGGMLMAVLLGTGFLCALYCFCMRLGFLWVLRLLPPLLAVLWLLICWRPRRTAEQIRAALSDGHFLLYAALAAGLILLFGFSVSVKNAHPAVAGGLLPNQDLMWNIGNANSFKIAFPPQDIRFSEVRLTYHYLTEMTEGILSLVSGLAAWDIIAFYIGPAVLIALVAALRLAGSCFYDGSEDKTDAFVLGLFLFNCASTFAALTNGRGLFYNYNLLYLVTNINGQATALIFASIFLSLFTVMARRKFAVSWRYLGAFLGCFVLLCFAKGPLAAIMTCSFAITMLLVLVRRDRPQRIKALAALAGVVGIFAVVYTNFYASGVNTSVRLGLKTFEQSVLNPLLGAIWSENLYLWYLALPVAALVLLFCMLPLQLPLYLRGLWGDIRALPRLPAERLLVNGGAVGGALAYFLFWHPSYSQIYFVLFAIYCIDLLAADQVGRPMGRAAKRVLAVLGAVGLLTTAVLAVNFVGSGARQLLRNLDLIEKYPYPAVSTAEDEAAADWLRENTENDAIFATNRIDLFPGTGEGVSCIYTALSGRQAYMEGYTYAVTNMGVSEAVVTEKKTVNAAFFSAATPPEEVLRLARENGIGYLVVSLQFPAEVSQLEPFALVYENDLVQIYRVDQFSAEG